MDTVPGDAITSAIRLAADHGDHVTPDQFKAGLAERGTTGRHRAAKSCGVTAPCGTATPVS